jgi:hypothetical protein
MPSSGIWHHVREDGILHQYIYLLITEILYNILTKFTIPRKQARLIKMCLNKAYSEVSTGKHLCDIFPNHNRSQMRPLGRPRRENNIKIDLAEIGSDGVDWA